jgi:hypothetical protein
MSVSSLSFSASLPPFYYTSGFNTNFSNANQSLSGNLLLASTTDTNNSTTITISSGINSNGLSYAENGASLNGNQLTVNYQTDNISSDTLNALTNANINGNGISFTPENAVSNNGTTATNYSISPNGALGETVQNAATSTGIGSQNIQLESVAEVGNTLTLQFNVGGVPTSTTTLAPTTAPQSSAPATPVYSSTTNSGAGFASEGYMTIGDVLAGTSGLTANGSLGNALQTQAGQPGLANAAPNAVLAATLNSDINLSPSTTLQVADFANTSLSAFPTTAPTALTDTTNNPTNTDTSGNSGGPFAIGTDNTNNNQGPGFADTFGNTTNSNSTATDFGASQPFSAAQTAIYSAISDASASNILGSNINTVA